MAGKNGLDLHFSDIGSHGVKVARDEGNGILWVQVPIGEKAVKDAPMSSTGKSRLVANTGGFQHVGAFRLNLTVLAPLA